MEMTELHNVKIYGASDDLVEVRGGPAGDQEYCVDDASFVLTGPKGEVRIRVWYTPHGMWAVAASPVGEGVPMLATTVSNADDVDYSAQAYVTGVRNVIREAEVLA